MIQVARGALLMSRLATGKVFCAPQKSAPANVFLLTLQTR
jgi:hypothetical protein